MSTNRDIIIAIINERINNDNEYYFVNDGNGSNLFPTNQLNKIRKLYNLDRNIEFLYCYKFEFFVEGDFFTASRNLIDSILILEDGFHLRRVAETTGWDKNPDFEEYVSWDDIEDMEIWHYINEETNEKKYFIKIFKISDNNVLEVSTDIFGLYSEDDEENGNFIIELFSDIKEKINENENNENEIYADIKVKIENDEYENALQIIKTNFDLNLIAEKDSSLYYFLLYYYSRCLIGLDQNKEGIKFLENRIVKEDTSEGFLDWNSSLLELKAVMHENLGNHYDSLKNYSFALQNTEDIEEKNSFNDRISDSYNKFKESFSELDFYKKKMILIYDEIKVSPSDSFMVLDKANLPANIKFPLTHPKKEEVYVAHPYLQDSYLPYSSFEADLFNDRFEEFSYFIQCLGAKSMTIKVIKESERITNNSDNKKTGGSIGLGKKIVKNTLGVEYEDNNDSGKKEDSMTSRTRTQNYKPTKKPYIPTNLLWYPHETSWHRIYQQRMNGNILNHHDIISSKSTHSISNNEKSNLKIGLKTFFADINLDRDRHIKNTIDESESIEWEIFVEFESLENLLENEKINISTLESSTFTDAENQYKEEVIFMLEDDGIIGKNERRILNRLRDKLKISDERAKSLESIFLNNFSQNEKEYIEEYKEFLIDGKITEKERRILNRFATRLEITFERVKELESNLM